MEGTPSFNRRGRFLAMKRASLHIEETPSLFVNSSIYAPLQSERGRGRGFYFELKRIVCTMIKAPRFV